MQFRGSVHIRKDFISLTSRLHLFFRNDVLSDIIFSTALIAFIYAHVMVQTFRLGSLIKPEHSAICTQRQHYGINCNNNKLNI